VVRSRQWYTRTHGAPDPAASEVTVSSQWSGIACQERGPVRPTERHSFGKTTSSALLDLDMRDNQPFKMIARTSPAYKGQGCGKTRISVAYFSEPLG
jgi:hypothetical protein